MSRTIQEIIAELEANRDEAAIRAAIEAQETALQEGNQAAYDQATQDRAFHEEVKKRIKALPLYYTPEQVEAYRIEITSVEKSIFKKHAERILPLIEQIQSIEQETGAELALLRSANHLILRAMNYLFDTDLPRGYRLPTYYGGIMLLPDVYQERMGALAGQLRRR